MEFINKTTKPPKNWETWFTLPTGTMAFDYRVDAGAIVFMNEIRGHLLAEQNSLCAYCQSQLDLKNSSIEHFIPKSKNINLSTTYHNLVAVCKNPSKDIDGKQHCDKSRSILPLPALIFYNDCKCESVKGHPYFQANQDGSISPNPNAESFFQYELSRVIEELNLNHSVLVNQRRSAGRGIFKVWGNLTDKDSKRKYMRVQFERINNDLGHPFRQYLLICIRMKAK
jgi:uncharacterized protein (TIGR02646 family)